LIYICAIILDIYFILVTPDEIKYLKKFKNSLYNRENLDPPGDVSFVFLKE